MPGLGTTLSNHSPRGMIMESSISRTVASATCLIVLYAAPTWSQSAVLKGKVMDAADNSPVSGAEIAVFRSRNRLGTGTSLADGTYEVRGLKRGDEVEAYYSRGGYTPNPMYSKIILSKLKTVQNIRLIHKTADIGYWKSLSLKEKTAVEATSPDPQTQARLYEQILLLLGKIGLPTDAQAQSARQLLFITPAAGSSHYLMAFATVDDKDLQEAEANIRDAVQGTTALSNKYGIAPDVAVSIATSEMQLQTTDPSTRTKFSNDFEAIWGAEASKRLLTNNLQPCMQPTPAESPFKCLGPNDLQNLKILNID